MSKIVRARLSVLTTYTMTRMGEARVFDCDHFGD